MDDILKSVADIVANLIIFVPLVLLFGRGWRWNRKAVTGYLLGSVPIAVVGTPLYLAFLAHVWYPLFGF